MMVILIFNKILKEITTISNYFESSVAACVVISLTKEHKVGLQQLGFIGSEIRR